MYIKFAALMIAIAVACESVSYSRSVAQSDEKNGEPNVAQSENTFTLSVPAPSLELKRGDTRAIYIAISRGGGFADDVSLKLENMPAGITIEPNNPKIAHDESSVKVTVRAAANAVLGNFTIKVVGHPVKGGRDALCEFKLVTEAK